jgi:RimJ/RimL family protein N-acetyltransferase
MTDIEEAKESIRRRQSLDHSIYGIWLITSQEGTPLGNMLLKPVRLSQSIKGINLQAPIEIGWQLHPDAQGCGYATEAAKAVLDDAANRGLRTVMAVVDPNNSPSIHVCERLHMTSRGITQDYYDEDSLLFDKELGTH